MIEFINKDSQHKVKLIEEKTKEEVMANYTVTYQDGLDEMMSKLDKDVKKLKTENNIQLSRNELSSKLQIDNAKQTVFIELKKEAKQKLATMANKKDAKYKS
mmetsp:Transcript_21467/g.17796  ORF Transcript_21467/g.17796 Transcript_21467/m.17796 type:complete len:102 (+) Transcript_21467:77-382(+)